MKIVDGMRVTVIERGSAPSETIGHTGIAKLEAGYPEWCVSFEYQIEGSTRWFYEENFLVPHKMYSTPLWKALNG